MGLRGGLHRPSLDGTLSRPARNVFVNTGAAPGAYAVAACDASNEPSRASVLTDLMDVGRGHHRDVGRGLGRRPEPSADPLRQLDDDPFRAAEVAEPIDVFVVLHLANELRAAGMQACDDSVDVVDRECEMADARGVRRRMPVAARARRGVKLVSSSRPWPSGISTIANSTRT